MDKLFKHITGNKIRLGLEMSVQKTAMARDTIIEAKKESMISSTCKNNLDIFVLKFVNLAAQSKYSSSEFIWQKDKPDKHIYVSSLIKEHTNRKWESPLQLITWGQGFACGLTDN